MEYSRDVLDRIGDEQGWNDSTKLELCISYITQTVPADEFEEYLKSYTEDKK